MIIVSVPKYDRLGAMLSAAGDSAFEVKIPDHLGGFDINGRNDLLDQLNNFAFVNQRKIIVHTSYMLESSVTKNYDWLEFKFIVFAGWQEFQDYNIHPELTFEKFICTFNGSVHVSRRLLTALLQKFGWFDPACCSKNFSSTIDQIDGHIQDYTGDRSTFYRKFFVNSDDEKFLSTVYSFGHERYQHSKNIYNLELPLTRSFVHVISETMATSYYPLITEKFLYSIVTRGLFLSYAPPGWHAHLEKYFGFKRYTKVFDYRFDSIINPVERLVELASMLAKFSVLTSDEWQDMYMLEQESIEYNYNRYFSQDYLKGLAKAA